MSSRASDRHEVRIILTETISVSSQPYSDTRYTYISRIFDSPKAAFNFMVALNMLNQSSNRITAMFKKINPSLSEMGGLNPAEISNIYIDRIVQTK